MLLSSLLDIFRLKANLSGKFEEQQQADLLQIVTLLKDDPLALEWAAMHTSATSLRATRSLLEQGFAGCSEARPTCQEIAQAALGCVLAALPSPLYHFLCDVSVFVEGWSVDAAEAVCNAPRAGEWCEELLRRHLVCSDTTRETCSYRLVDWVRLRLQAELGEDERAQLQQAHKDYFFTMACQAAPHLRHTPDAEWMQRLDVEKANLLAAIEACWDKECLQFGLAIWRWSYFSLHLQETSRFLLMARFACDTLPTEAVPEMYRALGCLFYRKKEYDIAKAYLEDAFHAACAQENWGEVAFTSQILANMYDNLGQLEEAQIWADKSLCFWQRVGSLWGVACILNEKGTHAWRRNLFRESKRYYSQSASIFKQLNDRQQRAMVLNNIGLLANTRHESRFAEKALRESLRCFEEMPDKRRVCRTLNNLAVICYEQLKFRQANTLFCKALALMDKIGYTADIPGALVGLAEAAHLQSHDKFAVKCIGMADYLDPNHKAGYNISDQEELDQTITRIRRAMRPQLYGKLYRMGQKMTLTALLDQLTN